MPARVDVWDPSAEGPFLVEQLRQAGFDVRAVELEDVPGSDADLVLLAGDADGALTALKRLRDHETRGGVPVVLVGAPPGAEPRGEGPAFGADAVFGRPVELRPFLERVRMLLTASGSFELSRVEAPRIERTMQLSDPDDPDSSQVLLREEEVAEPEPVFAPREPTMQLDDGGTEGGAQEVSKITSGRAVDRTGSVPPSRPGSDVEPAPRVIPVGERAEISPWLADRLAAADRRVFPDRDPLALHFPAADEPPEALVPRELFDAPAFRLDEPVVEDPIDAFTYVGGPAVPPPVLGAGGDEPETDASASRAPIASQSTRADARRSIAPTRKREHDQTTATEVPEEEAPGSGVHPAQMVPAVELRGADWPEDDTILGRPDAEGNRRGALGAGGALRLLWRICALGLDAICELDVEGGAHARLTFLAGELRAFDGPVGLRVLEGLRRRGRATESPVDEAGAQRVLQRRVEAGELGRFERDRLLREAREAVLAEVVGCDRAEFAILHLEDTEPGRMLARSRVLSRPLRAALVEAARVAIEDDRAIELLGGLGTGLAFGPSREGGLVPAGLASELVELISRMEGRSLREILAEAPSERGLASVLYALVAGDALELVEPAEPARDPEARASVQRLVRAASRLAADGDYFRILGVAPDASSAEVERAFRDRRDELVGLRLELLGLEALRGPREEALESVEEAFRAIADPTRRRAYAAALGL